MFAFMEVYPVIARLSWPVVIMLVLFAAVTFRYNIEATKTTDTTVFKWERDRWTGRLWLKVYGTGEAHAVGEGAAPWRRIWAVGSGSNLSTSVAEKERSAFTYIWIGLVLADALWLFVRWRRLSIEPPTSSLGISFTGQNGPDV